MPQNDNLTTNLSDQEILKIALSYEGAKAMQLANEKAGIQEKDSESFIPDLLTVMQANGNIPNSHIGLNIQGLLTPHLDPEFKGLKGKAIAIKLKSMSKAHNLPSLTKVSSTDTLVNFVKEGDEQYKAALDVVNLATGTLLDKRLPKDIKAARNKDKKKDEDKRAKLPGAHRDAYEKVLHSMLSIIKMTEKPSETETAGPTYQIKALLKNGKIPEEESQRLARAINILEMINKGLDPEKASEETNIAKDTSTHSTPEAQQIQEAQIATPEDSSPIAEASPPHTARPTSIQVASTDIHKEVIPNVASLNQDLAAKDKEIESLIEQANLAQKELQTKRSARVIPLIRSQDKKDKDIKNAEENVAKIKKSLSSKMEEKQTLESNMHKGATALQRLGRGFIARQKIKAQQEEKNEKSPAAKGMFAKLLAAIITKLTGIVKAWATKAHEKPQEQEPEIINYDSNSKEDEPIGSKFLPHENPIAIKKDEHIKSENTSPEDANQDQDDDKESSSILQGP